MARTFRYHWTWEFDAPRERLWPLVSDTNRFNMEAHVPHIRMMEGQQQLLHKRRNLRLTVLGIPVDWEEQPFEWEEPERFSVVRRYKTGPVKEMRVKTRLETLHGGGCRLTYQVEADARNWLGWLAIPVQIGIVSRRHFDRTFRRYALAAKEEVAPWQLSKPAPLAGAAWARIGQARARLDQGGVDAMLIERVVEVIERADDLTADRLRPYALADVWHTDRRTTLEAFLQATRSGILDFRWDVICPGCRGAKAAADTLSAIPETAHCDACHVDFRTRFEQSVELTFRPNRAVRDVAVEPYCIGGPQVTPHIAAQALLAAGEARTWDMCLPEGRYRLFTPSFPAGLAVQIRAGGARHAAVELGARGFQGDALELASRCTVGLSNATGHEVLLMLERVAWSDQAVTAAELATMQSFRDLFSLEALRPGQEIEVGRVAIVFTDLKGSTRLYREIGDAPAFGNVMEHFDILKAHIARHGGAIVKTIGDAVMASFTAPAGACRAMAAAQAELTRLAPNGQALRLKAGIHMGPCIAVTLNGRLDYFGSTVNFASRLEGLSTGEDLILSDDVHDDPEVATWLQGESAPQAEPFEAHLKGFDQEDFRLWRVRPRSP